MPERKVTLSTQQDVLLSHISAIADTSEDEWLTIAISNVIENTRLSLTISRNPAVVVVDGAGVVVTEEVAKKILDEVKPAAPAGEAPAAKEPAKSGRGRKPSALNKKGAEKPAEKPKAEVPELNDAELEKFFNTAGSLEMDGALDLPDEFSDEEMAAADI